MSKICDVMWSCRLSWDGFFGNLIFNLNDKKIFFEYVIYDLMCWWLCHTTYSTQRVSEWVQAHMSLFCCCWMLLKVISGEKDSGIVTHCLRLSINVYTDSSLLECRISLSWLFQSSLKWFKWWGCGWPSRKVIKISSTIDFTLLTANLWAIKVLLREQIEIVIFSDHKFK